MRLSAWDRRRGIVEVVSRWRDTCIKYGSLETNDGMTMTAIAKWLHMAPSSHLMRRIRECVDMGLLVEQKPLWNAKPFRSVFRVTAEGREWLSAMDSFDEHFT